MKTFLNRNNIHVYIFLYITILLLNIYTPFNGDDYRYAFNYSNWNRIENLFDVLESQITHYLTINGRTIPHTLEQIFAGITGKWLFNISNTLFLIWLINLITNKLTKNPQSKNSLTLITFIATLFLFSYPGQTMFWMAGSLNYLWPATLALYLLNIFENRDKKYNTIFVFLISLLSAWFQEAISIPFLISLIILTCINKSLRIKRNFIIIIGYFIGTSLIVFSPGTLARLSTNEIVHSGGITFILASKLLNTLAAFKNLYIFWISVILILVISFRTSKNLFYKKNQTYIILWCINICFFFLLGFGEERVTFFLSIISYILVIRIFIDKIKFRNLSIINFIIIIMSIVSSIYGVYTCNNYHKYIHKLQTIITNSSEEKVIIKYNDYKQHSRLIYPEKISSNFNAVTNKAIAMYYEKDFIQALKHNIHNLYNTNFTKESQLTDKKFITSENQIYPLYFHKKSNMYFFEIPEQIALQNIQIISYNKSNNTHLSKRQIFIRKILKTLDNKTVIDYYIFYKNKKYYCFIPVMNNSPISTTIFLPKKSTAGHIIL